MKYNLKKICKQRGLTLKELAVKAGIGYSTLTNIHYGVKKMSKKTAQKLAEYLGDSKAKSAVTEDNIKVKKGPKKIKKFVKLDSSALQIIEHMHGLLNSLIGKIVAIN